MLLICFNISIVPTIVRIPTIVITIIILKCFYFILVFSRIAGYVYPIYTILYTIYYTMFCIYTIWIGTHVRLHIDCYLIMFGFEFFIRISIPLICILIPIFCIPIPKLSIQFLGYILFKCLNLLSRVINFIRVSLNSFSLLNGLFNSFKVFILYYVRLYSISLLACYLYIY